MENSRVNFDVPQSLRFEISEARSLRFRVHNKLTTSPQDPQIAQSVDTQFPSSLTFQVTDIRVSYPSWATVSRASVFTNTVTRPVMFIPVFGVNRPEDVKYSRFTEQLKFNIIPIILDVPFRLYGLGCSVLHRSQRTQQSEDTSLKQLNTLQNSQPITFKVLRKVDDTPSTGDGGTTIADKNIPLGINVSIDSYVGLSSPTAGRFDTIADNENNSNPSSYVDDTILKIDQSTPAFRLVTGKNDVKISLQINPTYVISKRNKD